MINIKNTYNIMCITGLTNSWLIMTNGRTYTKSGWSEAIPRAYVFFFVLFCNNFFLLSYFNFTLFVRR